MFSAHNLALAEQQGLPMMVLCKCCHGSLKKAAHPLRENTVLRQEANAVLVMDLTARKPVGAKRTASMAGGQQGRRM